MEQPWSVLLLQEFGSFKETPHDNIEHYVIRSSTSDVDSVPPADAKLAKRDPKSVGIIAHAKHRPYICEASEAKVDRCV